ncbi:SEC-C domain-containing protein [Cryptosporangium sp. NPDC051539]|uniref:SEC-C domain-containing protein n=1 Tax=Cryptosporangium sp. NPDC051539 TaxID=3363962 RepID=UPI0037B7588C
MTEPAKPAEPTLDVRIDSWLRGFSKRRDVDRGKKRTKTVRVLVYWPEAEWATMAERWPQFVPEYGDDHDTHRRMVEDMLRTHSEEANVSLGIASLTVDGLVEFAHARELDPVTSETRAAYAAELGRAGTVKSWPPSLRQKCWCGSGKSYRECCAAL